MNDPIEVPNKEAVTQTHGADKTQHPGAFQLPHGAHQAGAVESAAGCYGAQPPTGARPAAGAVDSQRQPQVIGNPW
ncbi:hypothetical protein [Mycobacteroides abscessus]|uniref:hypothetical protein n=1 Tax=Mycobacteroides abscessus TaxID=36809 RepID=UPI0010420805|nr:hypothetical protein [Mycobacteroides abscessus]MDO3201206.1 hypothetical protein [Mycobacteroides abscessus subsp. abscessus]